ncbi:MAG TPA: WXG100 family type VII secretion target [Pseudonocardiaceae bacterium]|nr:WXG100 family type VII secretion target [Pseudonocardiaceae bacterium]
MTTAQSPGVVDMSGVVSSILQSYQQVLTQYQTMVTGDPDTVERTGTNLRDQASRLNAVSGDLTQRASTVAGTWQGSAATAYQQASGQVATQVQDAGSTLSQEAQRLSAAASLLRAGKSQMDSVVQRFQQAAQQLIAESRTAAAGAAGQFVQAARQLGESAVNAAKTLTEQVGETLAGLFGLAGQPTGAPGDKHPGEFTNSQGSAVKQALANQPWFQQWYRSVYGRNPDPKNLKLGALSWLDNNPNSVLDGRKRPRSSPSVFGNSGWWSVTSDGLRSAGTPPKANTPFGTAAGPGSDASTLAQAVHNTNVTLGTTGTQKLFDGSLVDDKASGTADLGVGTAQGSAEFDVGPRVTDNLTGSVQSWQLRGTADLKGTLVDANANGTLAAGPLEAKGSGDAFVGGDVAGSVQAGLHGVALHANAFAGAQATGNVSADVGGVGAGAGVTLQAGVGAQLDGQAMYSNGHVLVNAKAGAALGLGGAVSANIDVDVPKVWSNVQQYGGAAVNAVEKAAGAVGDAATQAATALGNAMSTNPMFLVP